MPTDKKELKEKLKAPRVARNYPRISESRRQKPNKCHLTAINARH